ncbi:MAG: hypothetical protein GX781_00705 [Clostridiales bacterium]|nr:hypothetical protein [Clostridiales bacterium]
MNASGAAQSHPLQICRWLLLLTLAWALLFGGLALLRLLSLDTLIAAADIYQLALGFALTAALLASLKTSRNRSAVLVTSLAIVSWTLGQLFWFSYTLLMKSPLPYPSVGDLGFTGSYFLLIGVLGLLKKPQNQAKESTAAFALLLLPLLLAVFGQSSPGVRLYNFVLSLAASFTLYKALSLRREPKNRWLLAGILALAASDAVFMTSVVLLRASRTATSAPLYPLALALIAYGILKREEKTDG